MTTPTIPTTMLAAVYQPGNQRLVLDRNYPIRELEDNEILIKIAATGVCHSDVELLTGVSLDARKYVFGHESCGYPVKLGSKVDSEAVQIGKLYSILPVDSCTHGVQGGPALFNALGIGRDGAYADYIIVTADTLVPVPEGVAPEVAAIAADAGVTSYRAVQRAAQVKPGDKVLIFGIGGLGHLALQYAKHFGATVYACDFKPEARKLALELGAVAAFDLIELSNMTAATNPPDKRFTVDTTMDFVSNNQTFNLAMAALRPNDVNFPVKPKCVMVGVSAENLVFSTLDTIATGVQILGSTGGEQDDLAAVLDLFAKDVIHAHVSSEPLENINKVLDELRASAYTGRKVVIPHPAA
ncbi:chaperonin 10-like protein [Mycena albidolilacea]|uniref:Chaperonin 10-like protein n=1 Tax=Mycena albidolilacea TaxID=1033008 RepID=A0AAD6Z813_9AGAR|nr:chaperonin 10-like protein [Mycena albidolilacea]